MSINTQAIITVEQTPAIKSVIWNDEVFAGHTDPQRQLSLDKLNIVRIVISAVESGNNDVGLLVEKNECKDINSEFIFTISSSKNREERKQAAIVKLACSKCVVRVPCLNISINNEEEYGIWGGRDEKERARFLAYARKYKQRNQ